MFFDVDKEMAWYKDAVQPAKHTNRASIAKQGANNPKAKEVYQFTQDGQLVRKWDCVADAAKEYDCPSDYLYKVIKGVKSKLHRAYGYVWSYHPTPTQV